MIFNTNSKPAILLELMKLRAEVARINRICLMHHYPNFLGIHRNRNVPAMERVGDSASQSDQRVQPFVSIFSLIQVICGLHIFSELHRFRRMANISTIFFGAVIISGSTTKAGLFSDTDFYVVEQKTSAGKFIDGWVVQGAPKNEKGVYIFTIYQTTIEKRIPIEGSDVTKVGPNLDAARKMLSAEIATTSDRIRSGF